MLARLTLANVTNDSNIVAEVASLVQKMKTGWDQIVETPMRTAKSTQAWRVHLALSHEMLARGGTRRHAILGVARRLSEWNC